MQNTPITPFALFFILTFACRNTPDSPPAPRNLAPSPFAGKWESEDNDNHNQFTLTIVQREDTLRGIYCAVTQDGRFADCPGGETRGWSFVTPNPTDRSFETTFRALPSNTRGLLRLSLSNEGNLFWQVLEAPAGEHYAWKETVLRSAPQPTN